MVIESAHFLLNCFGLVRQDIASETSGTQLLLEHPLPASCHLLLPVTVHEYLGETLSCLSQE